MTEQVIKIILQVVITGALGYCVNVIKNYKKKTNATNNALVIMFQTSMSNIYFMYEPKRKIPDYMYKNWLNMLKEYENLGGDDYVHTLAKKMETWEIVRTDILDNK